VKNFVSPGLNSDSEKPKKPLRLGLLCQSYEQPMWIRKALVDLISSNTIDIRIFLVQSSTARSLLHRFRSSLRKLWESRHYWVYLVYMAIDRKIHCAIPDALAPGRIDDDLSSPSTLLVNSATNHSGVRLGKTDLATLSSYNLDALFCLDLTLGGLTENDLTTFGVLVFKPPLHSNAFGAADVFWPLMEGFPVTQFRLELQQASSGKNQTLCLSTLPISLPEDHRSVYGPSNRLLWTASVWLVRMLETLSLNGIHPLPANQSEESIEPIIFDVSHPPTNNKMVRIMAKRCVQRTGVSISGMMGFDQWSLGYRLDETVGDSLGIPQFNRIRPPKDRFWADPFPVKFKDRYFIFVEEFLYSSNKGQISVIEMDTDGRWRKPEKILERDYHLSYPGVFLWEGNYYMLPESGSNRTIELYKCVSFPYQWTIDRILIDDIDAADPTIVEVNRAWWLFAATRPYEVIRDDNYMDLCVFHADSPMGPWTMIQNYPVKSDVRSSRPAGNLFWWKEELYRPAQDCSKNYGYAVSINKVTRLTRNDFREKEVAKIFPESIPGASCVHTINRCEGLTVIDMMTPLRRL
jgi:hypothetical protein